MNNFIWDRRNPILKLIQAIQYVVYEKRVEPSLPSFLTPRDSPLASHVGTAALPAERA